MLWVAPTEHQIHEILQSTDTPWKISSLPEKHGCDILVPTKKGIVGFQRKTLPDLVASLQDGRLYYELNQLITTATVTHPYLVIESLFTTTTDDFYVEASISVSTLHSLIAKFHANGVGFLPTQSTRSTVACCLSVSRYIGSGNADIIHRPKQVTNEWGRTSSRAYGIFLLQSFPGIGPKVAAAIYDHYGNVPITWTVSPAELAQVPGIGRRRAETLIGSLSPAVGPSTGSDSETGT
jgi:DNA excision repair protein ERCC-4